MCYGVHVGEYLVVQKESCYETLILGHLYCKLTERQFYVLVVVPCLLQLVLLC